MILGLREMFNFNLGPIACLFVQAPPGSLLIFSLIFHSSMLVRNKKEIWLAHLRKRDLFG